MRFSQPVGPQSEKQHRLGAAEAEAEAWAKAELADYARNRARAAESGEVAGQGPAGGEMGAVLGARGAGSMGGEGGAG